MKQVVKIAFRIVVPLIICGFAVVYLISVNDYDGVSVGMTYKEFSNVVPSEDRIDYFGYAFYANKWGNPVIVSFSLESETISEIHCLHTIGNSRMPFAFAQIKEGMSIDNVTAILGIPDGTVGFGLVSLLYYGSDGKSYSISFNIENGGTLGGVQSIMQQSIE